jgi:ribonuclease D
MKNATHFLDLKMQSKHFLSIMKFHPHLQHRLKISSQNNHNNNTFASLSQYCAFFLGKPLNKTFQCSRWQQRPLHRGQVAYAALDAHCLLAILERILVDLYGVSILDFTGKIAQHYCTTTTTIGQQTAVMSNDPIV